MEVTLHVAEDEQDDIGSLELIRFLTDIRGAYVAARMYIGEHPISLETTSLDAIEKHVGPFKEYLQEMLLDRSWMRSLGHRPLPKDVDLRFRAISRNSPMELIAVATGISIVALALAVCVSGGKVDLAKLRFEVNSPRETIKALRSLLRRDGR